MFSNNWRFRCDEKSNSCLSDTNSKILLISKPIVVKIVCCNIYLLLFYPFTTAFTLTNSLFNHQLLHSGAVVPPTHPTPREMCRCWRRSEWWIFKLSVIVPASLPIPPSDPNLMRQNLFSQPPRPHLLLPPRLHVVVHHPSIFSCLSLSYNPQQLSWFIKDRAAPNTYLRHPTHPPPRNQHILPTSESATNSNQFQVLCNYKSEYFSLKRWNVEVWGWGGGNKGV